MLSKSGFDFTEEPENADFILFNTCAVREHAEDRVFGNVGALKNINIFKAAVTKSAQDEVAKIKHSKMEIPLGAFTGLTLLSNLGPQIPLTFCLTGNFNSRIESTFESAGINQTIHHIRLIISSHIVTASVDHSGEMTFDTDYELAQSVIVGEIPTTYGGNRLVY